MKLKTLLLSILFFGLFACNNDDGCSDSVVNITSLEAEYGCMKTEYQMDIALSDTYVVIKSQVVFEDLVSGSCVPTIDFTLYDLVIGKKGLSSGNESIAYELIKDCETANETLTVTFIQNATAIAPNLTYHALIPKLYTNQELAVSIVVN